LEVFVEIRTLGRGSAAVLAAAFVFTGCGGSQAGAPAVSQQQGPAAARQDRAGSRKAGASTTAFTVSGRSILLDGKPFFIKGMDYGPAQINGYPDPNPLDDANEAIWSQDLKDMRAAGVNAIKVYNISLTGFKPYYSTLGQNFPLKSYETGQIGKFLDAAWNNGDHPIYVVLSIAFAGPSVTIQSYAKTVATVFELSAKEYGAYPAFMGFSIGNEINDAQVRVQPIWWQALNAIDAATKAGYKAAGAQKITTTTMVDDNMDTLNEGEKNHFTVDAWGINSYRGYTFTNIWQQFSSDTKKPAIISEYGYSTAYYPPSSATYDSTLHYCPQSTYPAGSGQGPYYGLPAPRPWELAKELPDTGNPNVQDYVDLVKANATEIYAHSTTQSGTDAVGSGGFYFEWNDEWWKSGWPNAPHIGGEGNIITTNAVFPGCYRDEGWFGLNSVETTGSGNNPFPARTPDKRVPKPALSAITAVWASE
jgi:hypothetical protein